MDFQLSTMHNLYIVFPAVEVNCVNLKYLLRNAILLTFRTPSLLIALQRSVVEACVLTVVALSTDVPGMFFLCFSLGRGCLFP